MHYKAFNLHFETPFECPELLPVDTRERRTLESVVVRFGEVPEHLDHALQQYPFFEANEHELLLKVPGVGDYLVRNGNEIVIQREERVAEETVRLYLFGSAVGGLLQQRGYLTLHASAIKTDKGAVLFAGDSGAGKSTTLQEFLRRGYRKLSDDTIALYYDADKGKVICLPSYPQSKIWQETAELFEHDTAGLRKIHPEFEKYALSTRSHFCDSEVPLFAVYILEAVENVENVLLDEIRGIEKFRVLNDNIYRNVYSYNMPYRREHFRIADCVSQHRIVRTMRPHNRLTLSQLCDNIEQDFNREY